MRCSRGTHSGGSSAAKEGKGGTAADSKIQGAHSKNREHQKCGLDERIPQGSSTAATKGQKMAAVTEACVAGSQITNLPQRQLTETMVLHFEAPAALEVAALHLLHSGGGGVSDPGNTGQVDELSAVSGHDAQDRKARLTLDREHTTPQKWYLTACLPAIQLPNPSTPPCAPAAHSRPLHNLPAWQPCPCPQHPPLAPWP